MSSALRLVALILFILAVFPPTSFHVALVPLGLAFWVASTFMKE